MYELLSDLMNLVLKILEDTKHMVNRYPGIHGLAHKDVYSNLMRIGKVIDPEVFSFAPDQFTFP